MTPDDAIARWYTRVDFERKAAAPGELKLDRMRELLHRLGNPNDELAIVHVAGTKGKGSTAAMFAAVARASGLKTGLFTSPHLVDVTERFQVDDHCISRDKLGDLLSEIWPTIESLDRENQSPTFFEISTAVGFLLFLRERVDLAIIEVGLGGRFDSTNVCSPKLSIITSISFDHTAILGNDLGQIAMEKCGIVKPGVPVVSGATNSEAANVIRRICQERQSPLQELNRDFHLSYQPGQVGPHGETDHAEFTISGSDGSWGKYELALLGEHQAANASLVVAGVRLLREMGFAISDAELKIGLAAVEWPGRMEIVPGTPVVVFDCAHNVASAAALRNTLAQSFSPCRRTLVFAASSDKDVKGMMRVLAGGFDRFVVTRFHNNPRAFATADLARFVKQAMPTAIVSEIEDPAAALKFARIDTELVVVAGSVFLVGETRRTGESGPKSR